MCELGWGGSDVWNRERGDGYDFYWQNWLLGVLLRVSCISFSLGIYRAWFFSLDL